MPCPDATGASRQAIGALIGLRRSHGAKSIALRDQVLLQRKALVVAFDPSEGLVDTGGRLWSDGSAACAFALDGPESCDFSVRLLHTSR